MRNIKQNKPVQPGDIHHVYLLHDPRYPDDRKKSVRYVGITVNPLLRRLSGHISDATLVSDHRNYDNRPVCLWIRELLSLSLKPIIEEWLAWDAFEYEDECSEADVFEIEKRTIESFKDDDFDLLNMTRGGGGTHGFAMSEEAKAKISKAHMGKKKSAEHARNIGLANIGRVRGPHSESARQKMSVARKGKKLSPEHCEKIGAWQIGRKLTPEHRANMSAAKKGISRPLTPEQRAARVGKRVGEKRSEETREKMRTAALKRPKRTAEHQAKIIESIVRNKAARLLKQ